MKARTVEQVRRERARTRRLAIGVILLMLASGLITAGMWYIGQHKNPQAERKSAGLGGGSAYGSRITREVMRHTLAPGKKKSVIARSAEDALLDAFPPGAGLVSGSYPEPEPEIALSDQEQFGRGPMFDESYEEPGFTEEAKPPTSFPRLPPAPGAGSGNVPASSFLPDSLPRGGKPETVVPLAPVPEPQTWLMLSLTPLLICLAKRRRTARRRPACYSTSAA